MIYCTLLNPALDVIYKIDKFQSGATLVDAVFNAVPAGKGINVARVVATLGEDVCVTGLMPEHNLKYVSDFLHSFNINHLFFEISGSMRINTTILEKNSSSITHLNSLNNAVPRHLQDEYLNFIGKLIKKNDVWSFSGSIPNGFENDLYNKLISLCSENGVVSMLDTRDDALKFGIRSRPIMIKPNLDELESLFDEPVHGVHHIALKGKRLLDMGVSYVFISLGSDGMIAVHGNDCLLCSAPQVKVSDSVGCGDAMVAGLLVAQRRGFSFPEMCRLAVACGSSKALHEGPGVVSRDEVWQLMEDVQITAV